MTDNARQTREVAVEGAYDERFAPVRDALATNLASGADCGASVAVYLDGEPVVDIWGGFVDAECTRPWQADTIVNVWSTTKTMTALCALILADRGELDLHAPVARYWPEFAANGKAAIEVRHLLSHTAGLSGWQEPLVMDDLLDWERCTSLLAAQAPWWEPGTASGYHAITQGYLVGEVVRRIAGQSLGTFFAEQVAGPLGADFHIGLDADHDDRVALVIPPPPLDVDIDPQSIAYRTLSNPALDASVLVDRRMEAGGVTGRQRPRQCPLGRRRSSRWWPAAARRAACASCRRPASTRCSSSSPMAPTWCSAHTSGSAWGTGWRRRSMPISPRSCFWGGWGGSLVINDLDARLTVSYMMNRMGPGTLGDERGASIVAAAYGALLGG